MTNVENLQNDGASVPDTLAVVSAFIDGEDVSAQALRLALDDAAAREYLVDSLALRTAVGAMAPFRAPAAQAASPVPSRAWWGAGAVAAMAIAVGGYAVGERTAARVGEEAEARSTIQIVEAVPASKAPLPTQIIELVPGKNWHVTGGK